MSLAAIWSSFCLGEAKWVAKVKRRQGKMVLTAASCALSNHFHQLTMQADGGIYKSRPQEKQAVETEAL